MIWCRFQSGDKVSYGIVEGDQVTEVSGSPFEEHTVTSTTHPLDNIKLLAPVRPPMLYAAAKREEHYDLVPHLAWQPCLPRVPDSLARRHKA